MLPHQDWDTIILHNPANRAGDNAKVVEKCRAPPKNVFAGPNKMSDAKLAKLEEELGGARVKLPHSTGSCILSARLKKKWSQELLARNCNVPQNVIKAIESGKGLVSQVDYVRKICVVLDIKVPK
jgi:ribosome-binding protein aMBF1 (putative translation factor)